MRDILVLTLIFVYRVSASLKSLTAAWQQKHRENTSRDFNSWGPSLVNTVETIHEYGCWCMFYDLIYRVL